ncbi:MAG: hypothetical protein IJS46_01765 [Kiritimatiellae bacterium]|nr:hypothetical protein [Kiritimatiellia bacterium]
MKSFTRRIGTGFSLVLAATALAALAAGCASMSDPDRSDLPWSQHNAWEDAPNLPPSMLNNH